jgi:hypothetical protein
MLSQRMQTQLRNSHSTSCSSVPLLLLLLLLPSHRQASYCHVLLLLLLLPPVLSLLTVLLLLSLSLQLLRSQTLSLTASLIRASDAHSSQQRAGTTGSFQQLLAVSTAQVL